MLQAIRDKTKGWIAYVIVAIIVAPLALVGVYNYFTGGGNPAVAEVEGQEITRAELDQAVQQYQARLRRVLGDQYERFMNAAGSDAIRRGQLDALIDQIVLREFARNNGIRVTDVTLRERITAIPEFQVDGTFSPERYDTLLQRQGIGKARFESQVRQSIMLQRFEQAVLGAATTTAPELASLAALEFQQRQVGWIRVDREAIAERMTLDEEQLRAYYEANRDAFRRPRQVRAAYIDFREAEVAQDVQITEDEIRARYEAVRDQRYTRPASRDVSHILIELPEDASQQRVDEARALLRGLSERIRNGESFEALAREYSDDPGSARQGGSLGSIRRGDMVGAFEEAAFALDEGELSEPVRTPFGLHLIRVSEIEPKRVQPLAEVREEIRAELAADGAEERFLEQASNLADRAFEAENTLEPVAEAVGETVQTTDWFSRDSGAGVASLPAFREAAFSQEVLADGFNSAMLEPSGDRRIVLRVVEERPATVLAFDEVRERVRVAALREAAGKRAVERAEALAQSLREGATPENLVADEPALTYVPGQWVSRRERNDLPPALMDRLFRMPAPSKGEASVATTAIRDGDQAVIRLLSVRDGAIAELENSEVEQLRSQIATLDGRSDWEALRAALRASADIEIFENRL